MEPSLAPSPKRLRNNWFERPESCYERFNFHREVQLCELLDLALSDSGPAVVVLAGEPGIGRGYVCRAVRYLAEREGHPMGFWDFDLRGFEPDGPNPLGQFLDQLVEHNKRSSAREQMTGAVKSEAEALSSTKLVGPAGDWAASLLSLVWQSADSGERFAEVLSQPGSGSQTPPREDPETLRTCLTELSSRQKLIIHVRDSHLWTNAQRRWFIREAERAPERLLLVVSCGLELETGEVVPSSQQEPARIELLPLTGPDLRQILDRRFASKTLPAKLVTSLVEATAGRPGAIANQMADLMEQEGVVEQLSVGLFEDIDQRLANEEPQQQKVLRDFLVLAALGGRYVPLLPIFEALGLDPEAQEVVTDFVDDVLEEELEWLADAGFMHPSFPGINVYVFTNALVPRIVLDQMSELDREVAAIKFLRFLEGAAQPRTRGMARWFLAIAEHLGPKERLLYELQLAWWCGHEDAEALQEEIRAKLEAGELAPETVWRIAREATGWPPYRRLTVLSAFAEAKVGEDAGGRDENEDRVLSQLSEDELPTFHALRAELLLQLGRYSEALQDARQILSLVGEDSTSYAAALNLSGLAQLRLGEMVPASADFEQTLAIYQPLLGSEHPATLITQSNLALTYREQGKYVQARHLEEGVLEGLRQVLGPDHPDTFRAQGNLAATYDHEGDHAQAQQLEEGVLEGLRRVLGPEHPATLTAQANLASTYRKQGELEQARQLLEGVWEARQRVLGPEHPDTLRTQADLRGSDET